MSAFSNTSSVRSDVGDGEDARESSLSSSRERRDVDSEMEMMGTGVTRSRDKAPSTWNFSTETEAEIDGVLAQGQPCAAAMKKKR